MKQIKTSRITLFLLAGLLFLAGCKTYKQDILFTLDENFTTEDLSPFVDQAESNYVLRAGDKLQVEVFTNKGERLVDPNFELSAGMNNQSITLKDRYEYLIQADGSVKLPIVGGQNLEGLTVNEAEARLEGTYNSYYKGSFVKLSVTNRRVIVLGGNGGVVIPLTNEDVSVIEILALYGGLEAGAKADRIRLIRGDTDHPQVYMIDLSTITGMKNTSMKVEPGDIIYIEPWRRPVLESVRDVRDILSIISVFSSLITIILLIQTLNQ